MAVRRLGGDSMLPQDSGMVHFHDFLPLKGALTIVLFPLCSLPKTICAAEENFTYS